MRTLICNAFSLNMLPSMFEAGNLRICAISLDEARRLVAIGSTDGPALPGHVAVSAVGHADTAALFEGLLSHPVPMARTTVLLDGTANLLVGQYSGPRLAEGATCLPDGAAVKWFVVALEASA